LDAKADEIVSKNGLYDLHTQLDSLEQTVSDAMASEDMDGLIVAFPKYMESNEAHLAKEENVMMPAIMTMMKAQLPLKQFMTQDILPTVTGSDDWEFFIKHANQVLEKHHGGMPRARVFDHALWGAATPEQWTVWNSWIKESLSEPLYEELQAIL
jgi:hypothetical protein